MEDERLATSDIIELEKYIISTLKSCEVDPEVMGSIKEHHPIMMCLLPFACRESYKDARLFMELMLHDEGRPWKMGERNWRIRLLDKCGITLIENNKIAPFWEKMPKWEFLKGYPLLREAYIWANSSEIGPDEKDLYTLYNNPNHDRVAYEIRLFPFDKETGERRLAEFRKILLPEWRILLSSMLFEYTLQCRVITSIAVSWLDARQKAEETTSSSLKSSDKGPSSDEKSKRQTYIQVIKAECPGACSRIKEKDDPPDLNLDHDLWAKHLGNILWPLKIVGKGKVISAIRKKFGCGEDTASNLLDRGELGLELLNNEIVEVERFPSFYIPAKTGRKSGKK